MKLISRALVASTFMAAGVVGVAGGAQAASPPTAPPVGSAADASTALPLYPEPSGLRPEGWAEFTDYTETIHIVIPPEWRHVELMPALNPDGSPRPWLAATPDMQAFLPADGAEDTFAVPGMVFLAYPEVVDTLATMAGSEYHDVCDPQPVQRFVRGWMRGHIQEFTECGDTASRLVYVAGNIDGDPHTYLLLVQLTGAADDEAVLEGLLSSFSPVTVPNM